MPTLGKVPSHLAPASKPAVTAPLRLIQFFPFKEVQGPLALDLSKCSHALAQIHQIPLAWKRVAPLA